ncbi:TPA: ESPR-type extended signal peptide-containing protein [Neisseria cinerea]
MNKIFRVVWSHAAQSWVAVSELTSAKGKTKSKTMSKLAALSLVAGAISMDVIAAETANIPAAAISTSDNGIFIGPKGKTTATAQTAGKSVKNVIIIGNRNGVADEGIVIGNDITSSASGIAADTLIGNRIRLGGGGSDSMSTALGYGVQVAGPSLAAGIGARSDIADYSGWQAVQNGGVALGGFASVGGNQNGGVAIGAIAQGDQNGSVAIGQLSGATRQFFDREATGSGGNGAVYNINENDGNTLTSIGHKAVARADSGVAVGRQANTSRYGRNAVAVGTQATAIKENAVAMGNNAVAGGYTAAEKEAIQAKIKELKGENFLVKAEARLEAAKAKLEADASAENKFNYASAKAAVERIKLAIARLENDLQFNAAEEIDARSAIAIGNEAKATNQSALAQGDRATATGKRAIAQGTQANSTGEDAIAQGAETKATGAYAIAQGRKAEATANFTIAQGNSANASAQFAMALGNQAKANIEHGVALGSSSETTVAKGVTGFNPTTQGNSDIRANAYAPLNGNALISTLAGVSVGSATNTRQINHVAAGTADDDAVNVAQLRSVNLKIAGNTNGETESAKSGDMRNTATSKADVLLDSQTLKVVSSNTDVLTTDATNNTITITPKTKKVEVEDDENHADAGKAKVPTTNGLVTATDLADTLNNMYWKIEADKNAKGNVSGKSTEAVKAGDKVRLIAGEGVKIEQNGRDFTFSVKNIVQRTNADG